MLSERKFRGRQKIEMKKMTNETNLQVTFSKRRSGLFKKASELCILCGANVALIVFSQGDKVFSFGHPNVDAIIGRYLSSIPPQSSGIMKFIEAQRNTSIHELNGKLTQINNALDTEMSFNDELSPLCKITEGQHWWAYPVDGLDFAQLELFNKVLEDLKKLFTKQADRLAIQGACTQTLPCFGGIGSSSNMSLNYQPNPQQSHMFPTQFFRNPMLEPHLSDFNNMGGGGGHGASGFF